eukprot:CAMPEP_0203638554 /NCGR_PEP_ID=MMETSP0088-20131115/4557_1 /ASSEMBLY_ACC=CAM_ASM_001087 /TAXON_ID=426623 /ORGANISM="Chaetoceros affinis, Strain CCMP159" /LENGTH=63 /DNA_ID=CAMNT_0050493219 /DNA_START=519 /DNA_END=710 /DNA_ORIENTATION=-
MNYIPDEIYEAIRPIPNKLLESNWDTVDNHSIQKRKKEYSAMCHHSYVSRWSKNWVKLKKPIE